MIGPIFHSPQQFEGLGLVIRNCKLMKNSILLFIIKKTVYLGCQLIQVHGINVSPLLSNVMSAECIVNHFAYFDTVDCDLVN